MALIDKITAIADAIRAKTGESGKMTLAEIPEKIEGIETGGADDTLDRFVEGNTNNVVLKNATKIRDFAFCYTTILSVEIPSSVALIAYEAFRNCRALKSAVMREGVTEIMSSAFEDCSVLPTIDIPSTVTSIGDWAFQGCSKLSEVHIKAMVPPTIGISVFNGTSKDLKIYVPLNSVDAYKTATNWSTLASKIIGE